MARELHSKPAQPAGVARSQSCARRCRKRELETLIEFVPSDDPILEQLVTALEQHLAYSSPEA